VGLSKEEKKPLWRTISKDPGKKSKKHVSFWDGVDLAGNFIGSNPTQKTTENLSLELSASLEGVQPPTCTDLLGGKSVWEADWGDAYAKCPKWKETWEMIQGNSKWPEGFKFLRGQLFFEEKLCVPLIFQEYVV
jgi:hypothetical protein